MAKYTGSVFGNITGKQGGVVASKWKGINYIREYVIPANPDTVPQQASRATFKKVAQILSYINESLLKPFWTPIPKGKSAYNAAFAVNPTELLTAAVTLPDLKVHSGSMLNVTEDAVFNPSLGNLTFTWETTLRAGESASDLVVVATVKKDGLRVHAVASAARSTGTVTVAYDTAITSGQTLNYCYFVIRADRSAGSDSIFDSMLVDYS